MDYLKRATIKNATAWDLYCNCVNHDHKLSLRFRRTARHRLKQDLASEKNPPAVIDRGNH